MKTKAKNAKPCKKTTPGAGRPPKGSAPAQLADAYRQNKQAQAREIQNEMATFVAEQANANFFRGPSPDANPVRVLPPQSEYLPGFTPPGRQPVDPAVFLITDEMAIELSRLPETACLWIYVRLFLHELSFMSLRSAWSAVDSLVTVVCDVLCDKMKMPFRRTPGTRDWAKFTFVLTLPATILGYSLASKFLELRYALAAKNDSKKRSANSTLRKARSVFSKQNLREFSRNKLFVPKQIEHFIEAFSLRAGRPCHRVPNVESLRALMSALAGLESTATPVYLVVLLVLYGGLRKGEMLNARSGWLISSLLHPVIQIRDEKYFETKNKRSRRALTPWWVFKKLSRLAGERDFIVSDDRATRLQAYNAAIALLRKHGMNPNKPLQDMRRFYASAVAAKFGIDASGKALGHGSRDTTYKCYLLAGFTSKHLRIWEKGPR